MTLYEMNQMGYGGLPKMAKSEIEIMKQRLAEWLDKIAEGYKDSNIYFMLLSPYDGTTHYYTLFTWGRDSINTEKDLAEEVISIVKDLGTLKAIEPENHGIGWEFWVTGKDAVTRMYMLFDYTEGVIEV